MWVVSWCPTRGSHGTEKRGLDIKAEVIDLCPTKCMEWDGKSSRSGEDCTRCMHCINVMPRALRPGTDTGATILVGAKAPILKAHSFSSVVIPFHENGAALRRSSRISWERCGTCGWKTVRTVSGWVK